MQNLFLDLSPTLWVSHLANGDLVNSEISLEQAWGFPCTPVYRKGELFKSGSLCVLIKIWIDVLNYRRGSMWGLLLCESVNAELIFDSFILSEPMEEFLLTMPNHQRNCFWKLDNNQTCTYWSNRNHIHIS